MMRHQVAILAGGKGTRLRERAGHLPKPLVPVAGKPVLVHQIERCVAHGLSRILLLVHHEHEQIRLRLGDGAGLGAALTYRIEAEARGTAGAMCDALPQLDDQFMVIYGDTYFDVDLDKFLRRHAQSNASATLFLHPNDHPEDSDLVDVDSSGRVTAVHPSPHADGAWHRNLVNAALYVFENRGLDQFVASDRPSDIAKHMFPAMLAAGRRLQSYISPEYIKDMGTPHRLDEVERDIESGFVERRSGRQQRPAVFLDRDGTLNVDVNHLHDLAQLQLLPGAADAVGHLNAQGLLAVVATNQPVVARGDVTAEGLEEIHRRLEWLLGKSGAFVDGIYVCPHHPDRGFLGEVAALKLQCDCRKPGTALLDAACRELGVDRGRSWFVGDSTADVLCGQRAGLRTVLLETGKAGRDGKYSALADYVSTDLRSAVHWIIDGHPAIARQVAPILAECMAARLVLIGGLARSGKSSAAQVLKEALEPVGKRAHVIPLDSWLLPSGSRTDGAGVLARYDIVAATSALVAVVEARIRKNLEIPTYDRRAQAPTGPPLHYSIGADDTILVEGAPALLVDALLQHATVRLYVGVAEAERLERMQAHYDLRGVSAEALRQLLQLRDADEAPAIQKSAANASWVIRSSEAE